MRRLILSALAVMAMALTMAAPVASFVTEGAGLRSGKVGTVGGKQVLYISEIDGAVSCYSLDGKKIWRNESPNPSVCFEIEVVDLDGDKSDDLLAVRGDGTVTAWSSKGKLMWSFKTKQTVRLSEIAVVGSGADLRIFTGGNNYTLYELDAKGKLLSETPVDGTVRVLASGCFVEKGKESLFVFTLKHDKAGSQFLGFIDPKSKKTLSSGSMTKLQPKGGMMMHKFDVADINGDGLDEVLVFADDAGGAVFSIDGQCKRGISFLGSSKAKQRYAHGIGCSLMPYKNEIVLQFGGLLYHVDNTGKLIKESGERHRGVIFNDFAIDPVSGTLFGLGQIGGDNSVYTFDLGQSNWVETKHEFMGLQREVEDNILKLYEQSLSFKMPEYQSKSKLRYEMAFNPEKVDPRIMALTGNEIDFIEQPNVTESTDRQYMVDLIGKDALKVDKRRKYTDSREDIIALAKKMEQEKRPFILWAGHGSDPFIVQIETMEQMVKVAPNYCRGFLYAEMANSSDPRVVHFVREYVPRLHKVITENNSPAKLYFRYKNMFWAADCHSELWREMFFSNKYSDILVPAAEDTNNRLQDLNFSGRVGMWMSGYVDDYAMRLVDDNPTSWRPLSPGGQRSVSPYLRNGAIMAAYGSRYSVIFSIAYIEQPGWNVLFALMASGVIPAIEREDILSVSSYMLIKDMDEEYLEHSVNNGHDVMKYDVMDDDYVIAKAGVHWCGADVPSYDYSKAMGVDYRWLNFIPKMPNGMIAVTDYDDEKRLKAAGADYFVTDARYGIVGKKKLGGEAFYPTMSGAVESGASKMLARVDGASWSLFRVGKKQARLVLVDPGYIDPQQRTATIKLQNKIPTSATNILTGEKISIKDGSITVSVPAGTLAVVDLEYSEEI
ncbi:MAG: hypothetical protein SNH88_07065 [Rikenellaceae bacterium]